MSNFTLPTDIIATITGASQNVISLVADIETAKEEATAIYKEVTAYMDSFLTNSKLTGSQKKEIVIQLIKDGWAALTSDFDGFVDTAEKWIDRISDFIDLVYDVYKKGVELSKTFREKFN